MVQFDDVTLALGGKVLFEHASFTLQKKERCGLVGRNGSGKSTLLRLIDGELEPDKGTVILPKHYHIGYLQQHISFTKPTLIEEAALGLPIPDRDQLYKAEKILFGLGFGEPDLESSPTSFSGGYQLRLNLAKVLISEPDCLLLDEPTNYLDLLSIRWLTNFLSKWPGEFILISHDRDFMDSVTTHTLGIHREKVKKIRGTTIDFFQQILSEEEIQEKTRLKLEKKRAHVEAFVERFGAKATKATQAQSKLKMLAREPVLEELNALFQLSFSFQEAPFPGKKMVEAKNLFFSYGDNPLIENFSIDIEKRERIAIIGKNGRGKSTLLQLLAGELRAKQGSIQISDNTRIGYFGQTHVEQLNQKHRVEEEIGLANPSLNYTQIKSIAGLMMFSGPLSEKRIAVLSGGEKSRVLLGKIIASPCNLLLLDEPTHHLDIESIEALIDALEDFSGTVLIVTHSELILRRLALDKIILCQESQQTLFLGNYDDFLKEVGWEEDRTIKKGSSKLPPPPQDRQKKLKKEIQICENKIMALEEEQKKAAVLVGSGNGEAEFLKAFAERQKAIEQLDTELYQLYDQISE